MNSTEMTYGEAIKYLYSLQLFGTRLGLENTFKLAELAGNPHQQLRFIHVAGTNGKGSTCAILESIYRTAGLRVGMFTSPHLVAFGERIQVNRQPISEADIVRLVERIKPLLAQFSPEAPPTFFEVITVMALIYFAEKKCELVIWETGLGGRLDATNIVTPLASVITNIQFDHQAWLGDTLARIAGEKAGIIKPGVPVITAVDDADAFRILYEKARQCESRFLLITWTQAEFWPLQGIRLPLLGEHQRLNAAVATHTVIALNQQIPVTDEAIRAGLQNVQWPGRLQLVNQPGGRKILLDGAHNMGGAETLLTALKTYFNAEKPTLILGLLRDKDYARICEILVPFARRIVLTPVNSQRTLQPAELAAVCRAANPNAEIREATSLEQALEWSSADDFVVISGSLYLIGEAMELLKLSPGQPADERRLNEWSGIPSKH
jgi:dihydrofolate synthase/folylpolyglutamate synthase